MKVVTDATCTRKHDDTAYDNALNQKVSLWLLVFVALCPNEFGDSRCRVDRVGGTPLLPLSVS
jgi:hypothetical protein